MDLIVFGIKTLGSEVLTRMYQTKQEAQTVVFKRGLNATIKEYRIKINIPK